MNKYDRIITVILHFIELHKRRKHNHANISALKCA